MKKAILFLLLILMTSMGYAQLPRTVLNCTLGSTKLPEVINQMRMKTYSPHSSGDGHLFYSFHNKDRSIDDYTPKLWGRYWQTATFNFSNDGTLESILFMDSFSKLFNVAAKTEYNHVREYLHDHYASDYWKLGDPVDKENCSEAASIYYHSGNLYYKLSYGLANGYPYVALKIYYVN